MIYKPAIFIIQTTKSSIISDTYTYGVLALFLLFNRFVLNEKWYLYLFFIFLWFLFVNIKAANNKKVKRFESIEELQKYLNENYPIY